MSTPTGFPDGLCDCFSDCGICCLTWYCPCCQSSQNFKMVDNPESCCKGCCGLKMPEFWIRQTMRRRTNLPENCCGDCCVTCTCLLPFAICQDGRALKAGFGVPLPGEGYAGHIRTPKQQGGGGGGANIVISQNVGQNNYAPPPPQGYAPPPPQGYAPPPPQGYAPPPPQGYAPPPPAPAGYAPPPPPPAPVHEKKKSSSSSSSSS